MPLVKEIVKFAIGSLVFQNSLLNAAYSISDIKLLWYDLVLIKFIKKYKQKFYFPQFEKDTTFIKKNWQAYRGIKTVFKLTNLPWNMQCFC